MKTCFYVKHQDQQVFLSMVSGVAADITNDSYIVSMQSSLFELGIALLKAYIIEHYELGWDKPDMIPKKVIPQIPLNLSWFRVILSDIASHNVPVYILSNTIIFQVKPFSRVCPSHKSPVVGVSTDKEIAAFIQEITSLWKKRAYLHEYFKI